jgi:hypothetical protein
MTLDFSVCLGLKRKQEKNSEEPHGVQAQTEVPPSWRTRKNQVLTGPPPPEWLDGEWMTQDTLEAWQLLVTNRKQRVELNVSNPLSRFSRHDSVTISVQQRMYPNLEYIRVI